MNPTATMLRWYRQSTSGRASQQQFTTEEVLQLLRPDSEPRRSDGDRWCTASERQSAESARLERSQAVRQLAAQPGVWLHRVTRQHRMEIGGLADRLPSLLFHHSSGGQPGELVRRFGGWSSWRYERALEVAASCIAGTLNQRRLVA